MICTGVSAKIYTLEALIIGCDGATAGKILADPELDAYLIRETDAVLPEDF